MLKFLFAAVLSQVVFSQQIAFQDDLMEGQITIVIEDNLGSSGDHADVWSERSLVTIRNVKLGQSQIAHSRPWNNQLTRKLKDLVKSNGFYKLRLHNKNSKEILYVHTFTDACLLYSSGLSEEISLLIDASPSLGGFTQNLVAASVMASGVSYCSDDHEPPMLLGHNTTVIIRSPATPTAPDTATFIQKIESMNKEKLENKDNRSFFVKYWMYIIPFVLLLATSYGGGGDGGR